MLHHHFYNKFIITREMKKKDITYNKINFFSIYLFFLGVNRTKEMNKFWKFENNRKKKTLVN